MNVEAKIIKAAGPIIKSIHSEALEEKKFVDWIQPEFPLKNLKEMVRNSTILPQCVTAYKDNICGFGLVLKYNDDTEETPEMKAEWEKAERIITLLSFEKPAKEVFQDLIQCREEVGTAFLEVIRSIAGEVCQIELIRDPETVYMTARKGTPIESIFYFRGEPITRQRKFRKFKQEKNGEVVYFKEFGDPRVMDKRTGEFEEGSVIQLEDQANEILDFPIGLDDYGCVRWIGQALTADGSRRAELLNNNYFRNGRHTPLAIIVSGGSLTSSSYDKLQEYVNGIKGENGQHGFLLLELEDNKLTPGFAEEDKPKVELKDLASILQKDELFQEYNENARKKVQSSFRLPDLYVGYTTDFNRSTAQTVQEVTEQQVFATERESLAWKINHCLLNEYAFKYVYAYFKAPNISNPDDLYKLLSVSNSAGGVTPNDARAVALNAAGRQAEPFDSDWGNVPIPVINALKNASQGLEGGEKGVTKGIADKNMYCLKAGLDGAIEKAGADKDDEVVTVMKEVRRLLIKMQDKEAGE